MGISKVWQHFLLFAISLSTVSAISSGCDLSCSTCAALGDSLSCTSCPSGNILLLVNNDYGPCVTASTGCTSNYKGLSDSTNTKCFVGGSCPAGYYVSGGSCLSCSNNCNECFGGMANQCLNCQAGYILRIDNDIAGTCIPSGSCTSPYSSANSTICANATTPSSCSTGCATCYSPSPNQCKSCVTTSSLYFAPENYNSASTDQWGTCNTSVTIKRTYYNFGFDPANPSYQYKCHYTCQSCTAEYDRYSCTSCGGTAYLSVMSQLGTTPVGFCKPQCAASEYQLVIGQKKYCYASKF